MCDLIGMDGARTSNALAFFCDVNSKINWDFMGPLLVVLIALAMLVYVNRDLFVFPWAKMPFASWWERRRAMKERKQDVEEIFSDCICDAVEEAYYAKLITLTEKKELYLRLAKVGFKDLLTDAEQARLEEEKLKQEEATTEKSLRTVHVL